MHTFKGDTGSRPHRRRWRLYEPIAPSGRNPNVVHFVHAGNASADRQTQLMKTSVLTCANKTTHENAFPLSSGAARARVTGVKLVMEGPHGRVGPSQK